VRAIGICPGYILGSRPSFYNRILQLKPLEPFSDEAASQERRPRYRRFTMRAVDDPRNSAAIREKRVLYGHRISPRGSNFVIA